MKETSKDLNSNEINKTKEGKIFGIIIFTIIILLIVSVGAYFVVDTLNKDNNKNNNTKDNNVVDKKETLDWETYTPPEKSPKKLYIEKTEIKDIHNYVYDKESEYYSKVGEYNCQSNTCVSYEGEYDYITISDNNNFYVYDYVNNKIIKLNLTASDYSSIHLYAYNNKVYGVMVVRAKDEKQGFYSLEKKKIIIDFIYDSIQDDYTSLALTRNQIFTISNVKESKGTSTRDINVVDIDTGNILYTFKDTVYDYVYIYGNESWIYYYTTLLEEDPSGNIYNDKFTLLFKDINKTAVGESGFEFRKTGNIIIGNKTNYKEYDSSGKLLKTSKTYKSIDVILDKYVVAIDNDNYIILLDENEKVLTKFVQLNDNLQFHPYISGYYEKEGYPYGIYIVVENKTIPYGTKGSGIEYYYATETGKTGKIETEGIGGYAKPVLYLYPEKETLVTVDFEKPELLTTTYPKYTNSWKVKANPNGDLKDFNGKYYYALYWEEEGSNDIDFNTGFYVTKDDAINFLEDKLSLIGLNDKERNEFIMYWLPILEKNGKNLVYFELTEERDSYNKININPKPDTLLRVAIHIKKVDKKVNIKEEKLKSFNRKGFTAVEWGGVIH